MPTDINWPVSPLLSVLGRHGRGDDWPYYRANWNDDPSHFPVNLGASGTSIKFIVHLASDSSSGSTSIRITTRSLDVNNNPTGFSEVHSAYANNGSPKDIHLRVPLAGIWTRFSVSLEVYGYHSMSGYDYWYPAETRIFTLYTKYFGDFSLDYLPITILYCPPGQDMTSSFIQSQSYGTIFSVGLNSTIGNNWGSSQTVRGGAKIGVGVSEDASVGIGVSASSTDEYRTSQSVANISENIISATYEWGSRVIADNQRAIGRAYWGPLGDIFVLLKNPWFEVTADKNKNMSLGISEKTRQLTHLLFIPAHKLLRPGTDPIASQIPAETRRRLLELDPFIINLSRFFPVDQGDDLATAADAYADPTYTVSGSNRAAVIGRYSIDTGVVLDLTHSETIKVADRRSNATTYSVTVSEIDTVDVNAFFNAVLPNGLMVGGSLGGGTTTSQSAYTEISYLASHETYFGEIRTAQCSLIRNQNETDLEDIEVWWDKVFSTFMFRKIKPGAVRIVGWINGLGGKLDRLFNFPVELILEKLPDAGKEIPPPKGPQPPQPLQPSKDPKPRVGATLRTMADHLGYFGFPNITRPGTYLVRAGNKSARVKVSSKDIADGAQKVVQMRGVMRVLDLKKSAIWEMMEGFSLDRKASLTLAGELSKIKRLDDKKLSAFLKSKKMNLTALKTNIVIKYPKKP